jgi:hypothetical protein
MRMEPFMKKMAIRRCRSKKLPVEFSRAGYFDAWTWLAKCLNLTLSLIWPS